MKKILFTLFLINSIASFAEKKIYIQYYPNPQTSYDCFFGCDNRGDHCGCLDEYHCFYCLFCCFNWKKNKSNNLEYKCVMEIKDQEGLKIDLMSEIERKLLHDGVFLAKYGNLHFYVNGKEIKDGNFDLNELNVILVRQK